MTERAANSAVWQAYGKRMASGGACAAGALALQLAAPASAAGWGAALDYCVTPLEEGRDVDTSALAPIEGPAAQMFAGMLGGDKAGAPARVFLVAESDVLLLAEPRPGLELCMFIATGAPETAADKAEAWAAAEIDAGRYRALDDSPLWNVLGVQSTGWRSPDMRVTVHQREADGFFGVQVTELSEDQK